LVEVFWLTAVTAGKTSWTSEELERRDLVENLYHAEAANLVRLARLFTDDRTAAEDLVQEAFIRFYRNIGRIRDEAQNAAYLRSIVLNLARDHNRRGLLSLRHHEAMTDRRVPQEPDQAYVRSETHRAVLSALESLSARQRECLVLRFYFELSEAEIAASLSISPNSVKTHCQRGMAALASILGSEA